MTGERKLLDAYPARYRGGPGLATSDLWSRPQVEAIAVEAAERAAVQTAALVAEFLDLNGRDVEAFALRQMRLGDLTGPLDLGEPAEITIRRGLALVEVAG